MSSWAHTKYKTKNWSSYNDSLKQHGSLSIWFVPEMVWTPPPSGKLGRQQQFSDAAIQTCLTLKVLFGMPLRQTTGFVQSLLWLVGLDWAAPDFSTLCRRQQTLNVSLPYRGSTGPLNLLIDSTGIKRLKVKASGTHASTQAPNAIFGVRYTLASMRKRSKYGRSKSPVATLVTHPCYPNF